MGRFIAGVRVLTVLFLITSCATPKGLAPTDGTQGVLRVDHGMDHSRHVPVDDKNFETRLEYFYLETDPTQTYREMLDLFADQWNPPRTYLARVHGFLTTYLTNHPDGFLYYFETRKRFKSKAWVAILDELLLGKTTALAEEMKDLRYVQSPMSLIWGSYFCDASPRTLRTIVDWYANLNFPSDDSRFYAKEIRAMADRHAAFRSEIEKAERPIFQWALTQPLDKLDQEARGLDRWYRLERFLDGGDSVS